MNAKFLLAGSAAIFATHTSAMAADAILVAPEPVDYVRVCDAYGAGFYYVPGTQTCLQIGGYVRFQIGFTSERSGIDDDYFGFTGDQYNSWIRARLNFDARTETEWGTLRSYIRFEAESLSQTVPTADAPVMLDQGFIEIAGFVMGYTESAWESSISAGYGQAGSFSDTGLFFGSQQRTLFQYNYVANGFGAGISLEDDATGDYAPDIVGTLSYSTEAFGVWAKVGYDEEETVGVGGDAWGATLGAQVNFGAAHNFKVQGFYADYDVAAPADPYSGGGGGEWSLLASYRYTFSESLNVIVGAQYIRDTNYGAAGNPDGFVAEGEVNWYPAANFEVKTGLAYSDFDASAGDDDTIAGFIRFERAF